MYLEVTVPFFISYFFTNILSFNFYRSDCIDQEHVVNVLKNAKPTETLKKLFLGYFDHGPALLEHFFKTVGVSGMTKLKDLSLGHDEIASKVVEAFGLASKFVDSKEPRKGYIVMRTEVVPDVANPGLMKELSTYEEFHPVLFKQHESLNSKEFETFNQVELIMRYGQLPWLKALVISRSFT